MFVLVCVCVCHPDSSLSDLRCLPVVPTLGESRNLPESDTLSPEPLCPAYLIIVSARYPLWSLTRLVDEIGGEV